MSGEEAPPDDGTGDRDHPATEFAFTVVEHADGPDECTICPRPMTAEELLSAWITCERESAVDLSEFR